MITLYKANNGTIYLHQANSAHVYQLPAGTSFAEIEKAVQAILDDEVQDLQVVHLQDIRSVLNALDTEIICDEADNEAEFLRSQIAYLEAELRLAKLPHPMQKPAMDELQDVLEQLQAMQPLAASDAAGRAQYEQMKKLTDDVKSYALWIIPNEMRDILRRIEHQYRTLCS